MKQHSSLSGAAGWLPAQPGTPTTPVSAMGLGVAEKNETLNRAFQFSTIDLDEDHLEKRRVVGQRPGDPRSKPYDILRTQVLQSLGVHGWHLLGVTSPSMGCGKTHTSINLAMSIARQSEKSPLLIDMDFRKPQLASRLGVSAAGGLLDVLAGRCSIEDAIFEARTGTNKIYVLPTEATEASSELMGSRAMRTVLQGLRTHFRSHIVILDLPPMLIGDEVLSIVPHVDCMLLVTAVGASTVAEVEECGRHLQSTNLVRVVVNKVPDLQKTYY